MKTKLDVAQSYGLWRMFLISQEMVKCDLTCVPLTPHLSSDMPSGLANLFSLTAVKLQVDSIMTLRIGMDSKEGKRGSRSKTCYAQ